MDFVFRFLRKTVAPANLAESGSTTVPDTTRWPRFCARAMGVNPLCNANGTKPAAKAASITEAAKIVRLTLTLPPRLLRKVLRLHPGRRQPASVQAARHRQLRTRIHIRRR